MIHIFFSGLLFNELTFKSGLSDSFLGFLTVKSMKEAKEATPTETFSKNKSNLSISWSRLTFSSGSKYLLFKSSRTWKATSLKNDLST